MDINSTYQSNKQYRKIHDEGIKSYLQQIAFSVFLWNIVSRTLIQHFSLKDYKVQYIQDEEIKFMLNTLQSTNQIKTDSVFLWKVVSRTLIQHFSLKIIRYNIYKVKK
jgi:hypothetical protein